MITVFRRRRHIGELARSEDGVAFIELAVVLPLLALLVFGLIETGRYLAFGVRLGNAAHAGAQFGSQNVNNVSNPADIETAACNDSGFSCTGSTPKPGTTSAPDVMAVTSSYNCTYSNGTSNAACPLPSAGVQRNMFVIVSTSGTFKAMLDFPYVAKSVPMSATATIQVGQ